MFRTKDTPRSGLYRRAEARSRLGGALARRPEASAGPRALKDVKAGFATALDKEFGKARGSVGKRVPVAGRSMISAMATWSSRPSPRCTNTSNPSYGGRRSARPQCGGQGPHGKPWVKTSLAPGSQVVGEYLARPGLQKDLDKLGFNLVGYGCTTCIGNSGPLPAEISKTINETDLVAAAVLSGNRNFEGRVNQDVRANYLASPPLVVAYAIAGTMNFDFAKSRSAPTRPASRCSSRISGRAARRSRRRSRRRSPSRCSTANMATCSKATRTGTAIKPCRQA